MVWDREKVVVFPFDGYLSSKRLFVIVRVLSYFKVNWESESKFSLLAASLKRWYTNEIAGVELEVSFLGKTFPVQTNSEGFVSIDLPWEHDIVDTTTLSISFRIISLPKKKYKLPEEDFIGKVFFMGLSPKTIVISDIDDTILHTNVLSKSRMVYNSVLLSPQRRHAIQNSAAFLFNLTQRDTKPIFYISNSPYNLYYYLQRFLSLKQFPTGPLFLRDYGRRNTILPEGYESHKHYKLSKIMEFFPESDFILLGDDAEHDPGIYYSMRMQYKDRIKQIFLRFVGNSNKIKNTTDWRNALNDDCIHLFHNYKEAEQIAQKLDLF